MQEEIDIRETDLEEMAIAMHEAAHAVAAYLLPYAPKTKRLSIEPIGESMGRRTTHERPSFMPEVFKDLKTKARAEAMVVVLLAGAEGACLIQDRYDAPTLEDDCKWAMHVLKILDPNPDCVAAHFLYCKQLAMHIIRSNSHLVEELAALLLAVRTLNGRAVKAFLDKVSAS